MANLGGVPPPMSTHRVTFYGAAADLDVRDRALTILRGDRPRCRICGHYWADHQPHCPEGGE